MHKIITQIIHFIGQQIFPGWQPPTSKKKGLWVREVIAFSDSNFGCIEMENAGTRAHSATLTSDHHAFAFFSFVCHAPKGIEFRSIFRANGSHSTQCINIQPNRPTNAHTSAECNARVTDRESQWNGDRSVKGERTREEEGQTEGARTHTFLKMPHNSSG